jgi:adenosylhomocysteine nucleosidase
MNLIVFALKEEDCIGEYLGWTKVYTGVGKINASYSITKAIEKYKPNKVINFGTAGGINLKKHCFIKIDKFIQLDMKCSQMLNKIYITPFENDIGFIGENGTTCGTSDTFITDSTNLKGIVDLVDMECYALAKICKAENILFESYKYVTDECNGESLNDWKENIKKAKQHYEEVMENE